MTLLFTIMSMLLAGLFGITLSVSPNTPAVILAGVAAITAAIALIVQALRKAGNHLQQKPTYAWLSPLMILAIIYFLTRAWYSPVQDLGIEDLMLALPAAIFYLLGGYALAGKQSIRLRQGLAWVVILLLILHVVSALMQMRGGDGFSPVFQWMGSRRASDAHVTGMFGYYGSFANFAVMAGLLCLSLGVWGRCAGMIRVMVFLLGLTALGLAVLSQSRSAVISMFFGLVVLAVFIIWSFAHQSRAIKKRATRLAGSVLGLLLLGAMAACVWIFQTRAGENNDGGLNPVFDSVARLNFWPMAFDQWIDYPLLGAGARSFSYLCNVYWNPNLSPMHANPEFVHNEYLQLLSDYGLIGLLAVLAALAGHLVIGWRQTHKLARAIPDDGLRKGSNAMALTLAGVSGIIAMGVHICFDFRTHLQANLLLLTCCAVWVLPIRPSWTKGAHKPQASEKRSRWMGLVLPVLLLLLGVGACGLGAQQLWAGMPLLENRKGKEDGAWKPLEADKSIMIPMFEKSLARAPHWKRYQRLGILYKLAAEQAEEEEEKRKYYGLAEAACIASIARHPYAPVSSINLASIYTSLERFDEADALYASTSEMASAREPWFKMHMHWAVLHHKMAMKAIREQQAESAQTHFDRAYELFELSDEKGARLRKNEWRVAYAHCLLANAIYLDRQRRFEEAQAMYEKAEEYAQNWTALGEARFHFHQSQHYYNHGFALWQNRRPSEAYQMMLKAEKSLLRDEPFAPEAEQRATEAYMLEIKKFIQFFKDTGIAN